MSLFQLHPSPVVALNLAIAKANGGLLKKAFEEVVALNDELNQYQPYHAARGELESRLNLNHQAITSISKAISLSKNSMERDFLIRKKGQLEK
jgi:RNA polymerase sigma-70 factor (ECF subfamily)